MYKIVIKLPNFWYLLGTLDPLGFLIQKIYL